MGWAEAQARLAADKRFKEIEKSRSKKGLAETIQSMELTEEEREAATERQRIDDQWEAVKPNSWGRNMNSGERRMLYGILTPGESIEAMVGGTFRQDTARIHKHNGIAVATDKRVIFADHGIIGSDETMQINYSHIESITHSKGIFAAGIQVVGIGASSYRIEDVIDKSSVPPFVDCVQGHLDAKQEQREPQPSQPAEAHSIIDELERLASLVDRGFLERSEFETRKRQLLKQSAE